jgi:hypothetical protein
LIEVKRRGRQTPTLVVMDLESLHARLEHETAELRAAHPEITHCNPVMLQWTEGAEPRFSLHLDIRRPQQQLIVSGAAKDQAQAAAAAGFQAARERLEAAG